MSLIRNTVKQKLTMLVSIEAGFKINPTIISVLGFGMACTSAGLIVLNKLGYALVFLILAGIADLLDGAVARANQRSSPLGTIIDGLMDRLSDTVLLISSIYTGIFTQVQGLLLISGIILIPYVRASFERYRIHIPYGIVERLEMFVFLGSSLVLAYMGQYTIILITTWIIVILLVITLVSRIYIGIIGYNNQYRIEENAQGPVPLDPEETTWDPDTTDQFGGYAS